MKELTHEEKLYALMAHAEDLQNISAETQKELRATIAAVREMAKNLPSQASGAVSKSVSEVVTSRLIGPAEQAGADFAQAAAAVKTATKGLWLYPAVIVGVILVVLSGYTYFGVNWVMDERDQAKAELEAINHELAQTANVTPIGGQDGYWVEIDKSKKIIIASDDKTYARMPRR